MPTVDVLDWVQTARDSSGRVLQQRKVTVLHEAVRKAVNDFSKFVTENNGDLETSVAAELQEINGQVDRFLKQMNESRSPNDIRALKEPMGTAMELASYLEIMLSGMRLPLEGAMHIVRHTSPTPGQEVFSLTFAPYMGPGGALKPRVFFGRQPLEDFLVNDVGIHREALPGIFQQVDRDGATSIPSVQLSSVRMKALQLS